MATRTEVTCLAAEGEQIIMAAVIAVDPGKAFVRVTAIDKPIEYLLLYPTVNHAGSGQILIMLSHTLIEWAGVGISWAVYARLCSCFHATHDALHGAVSLLATLIVDEISILFLLITLIYFLPYVITC
jgi:hypothetical protein